MPPKVGQRIPDMSGYLGPSGAQKWMQESGGTQDQYDQQMNAWKGAAKPQTASGAVKQNAQPPSGRPTAVNTPPQPQMTPGQWGTQNGGPVRMPPPPVPAVQGNSIQALAPQLSRIVSGMSPWAQKVAGAAIGRGPEGPAAPPTQAQIAQMLSSVFSGGGGLNLFGR